MRKTIFANEEYYHIYNRGVDKRDVFMSDEDYVRFLLSMNLLNDKDDGLMLLWRDSTRNKVQPLVNQRLNLGNRSLIVEIIAYCLNPNHYHFILKQKQTGGVVKFMRKLGTSYTMYFNKKYERSGSLFQGRFKSIHIDSNEYLLHLSVYVNKNNFIHGYEDRYVDVEKDSKSPRGLLESSVELSNWRYSSFLDYIGKRDGKLCNKEIILDQFSNKKDYADFMDRTGEYFKDKKGIEKYLLE